VSNRHPLCNLLGYKLRRSDISPSINGTSGGIDFAPKWGDACNVKIVLAVLAFALAPLPAAPLQSVKVTILSTMLVGGAGDGEVGEWGFSALVEADGRRILFDTGARPDTVLHNLAVLGIDLSNVTDVVLSHNHGDHTGGLLTLRQAFVKKNPDALSRVHVGRGILWSRGTDSSGAPHNPMPGVKTAFEATGGKFIEHANPGELAPGIWFTGPIPREFPEHNYGVPADTRVNTPGGEQPDIIPEDSALVLDTARGLVVITGCGHAGVVNTLTAARQVVRAAPIHALIGGAHLLRADEKTLVWTGEKFRAVGVAHFLAAHCTGLEATYRLRTLAGLTRETCVVAAVGATFDLERGIDPLMLAR
jgi:7,8-dihydropterin-6-yl-methyl-4-(beta-D-ribofuranosyl)aminobenzene 5'-phosphate synthase